MHILKTLSVSLFIATLVACGGGGGSDNITYSGVSTPASIDNSNARELSVSAVNGSDVGSAIMRSSDAIEKSGNSGVRFFILGKTLRDAAIGANDLRNNGGGSANRTVSDSGSNPGSCGGSYSYNLSLNDVTGTFSGTFTFRSYDDCTGYVINGSTNVSGTIDLYTLEFMNITYTFNNLSATSGSQTETLAGSIAINATGYYSYQVTYNTVYRDASSKTYKLENYIVAIDESGSPISASISGRVYHPDYGYVTVSTTSPILIYYWEYYPHAGVLELTGEIGSGGGPTSATVTFGASDTFTVVVDSDGDGVDDSTHSCSWSTATCTIL